MQLGMRAQSVPQPPLSHRDGLTIIFPGFFKLSYTDYGEIRLNGGFGGKINPLREIVIT
jgi:hypothetical protein